MRKTFGSKLWMSVWSAIFFLTAFLLTGNNLWAQSYPRIDLNNTKVFGISPYGEKAASTFDLNLTDAEKSKLKAGHYTVAFVYHMQDNEHNQTKLKAARDFLETLGIKTVSVADAGFKVEKQIGDIESTMALKPDVMFVMPIDPDATASALKRVVASGTKIVFMENVVRNMVPGKDYIACVNSDSYGNGKVAADILAYKIGYEGEVAMVFFDAAFFVTNERDRGFRETIKKYYPKIKIVDEVGFADPNKVGTVADSIFANYPKIKGIYASWDQPADDVIVSAKSANRNDVIISTCDLGENTARMIASDGFIRGTAAARSYDQGIGEAMAACYGLLGKKLPSTYLSPPALPVMKENVVEAYKIVYHLQAAPEWLTAALSGTKQ